MYHREPILINLKQLRAVANGFRNDAELYFRIEGNSIDLYDHSGDSIASVAWESCEDLSGLIGRAWRLSSLPKPEWFNNVQEVQCFIRDEWLSFILTFDLNKERFMKISVPVEVVW